MGRFGSAHFGSAARVLVRLRSLLCLLFSFCSLPGLLVGSFGAGKWGEISSSQPVIMHTIYLRLISIGSKSFSLAPSTYVLVLSSGSFCLCRVYVLARVLFLVPGFWFLLACGLPPLIVARGFSYSYFLGI